jgi:hypothetical protein
MSLGRFLAGTTQRYDAHRVRPASEPLHLPRELASSIGLVAVAQDTHFQSLALQAGNRAAFELLPKLDDPSVRVTLCDIGWPAGRAVLLGLSCTAMQPHGTPGAREAINVHDPTARYAQGVACYAREKAEQSEYAQARMPHAVFRPTCCPPNTGLSGEAPS